MGSKYPKTLVDNAADPAQVSRAERVDKRRLAIADEDLQYVLKTGNGRRVIQNILDRCCIDQSIWQASAAIHFLAGKQDIGFQIKRTIEEACPETWLLMERERLEHQNLLRVESIKPDSLEESD